MASKEKLFKKPPTVDGLYTFDEVVEKACDGLLDCQIKYSIRRIQEMEESLSNLERELDDFLFQRNNALPVNLNKTDRAQ